MHNNAAGMAISVQANANKLWLARAHQRETRSSPKTKNSTGAGGGELKASLQRAGLDLNNMGLKTKSPQQTLEF